MDCLFYSNIFFALFSLACKSLSLVTPVPLADLFDQKILLSSLAAISIVFWNLNNLFRDQWKYCQDLYNKMIQERRRDRHDLLANSLAIDLLVVDLWAHRSFSELFAQEMKDCLENLYGKETAAYHQQLERLNAGQCTETELRDLLEFRHACLLSNIEYEDAKKSG